MQLLFGYHLQAGVFPGCVERLAAAFLAEPSDDTLFNILDLPEAGLGPGLQLGLKPRLEQYPRVHWPRPEPSDGTTPGTTTAIKDVEKGRLGSAARRLAGTAAVAAVNDEVVATLRDKHPTGAAGGWVVAQSTRPTEGYQIGIRILTRMTHQLLMAVFETGMGLPRPVSSDQIQIVPFNHMLD
jgi:hypothetical protein